MVVECVKAIIGWEPTSGSARNIEIAYLTLLGKHLSIGLCGAEELTEQAPKKAPRGMVAIQCGGGSWTSRIHLPKDVLRLNLSRFSTFVGSYDGVLPGLNQSYDSTFDSLIGEFETVWSNLTGGGLVVFFCKAGRHRSYALLIAFLMWAGHVHDYSVWAGLVAPVRNKRAKCDLHWHQTPGHTAATVPFGDVLLKFADYLNSTDTPHRWPAHAQ